jgi:hypothetical protein
MCPVCIAAAALIAGKVTSTGGAAAIVIKKFGGKNTVDTNSAPNPSKLAEKENRAGEIVPISNHRRDQYANDRGSYPEDRVA